MLRVRDLRVSYGRVPVLHGLSLEVAAGQITAVVGANGAGKSTLLRAIAGLCRADAGSIELDGKPIHALAAHRRVGLGLSLIPEGRRLFPRLTVRRNLELGAFTRRDRSEIAASLELVLATFPFLGERLAQLAGTLSGGEQQMVAIGRGLMSRPRLLMLDEPSLGLAPNLVELIFETIAEIRKLGCAIMLVEQNASMALEVADFGYVLETGTVTLSGPAADLKARRDVIEAYLG